jgi:hypothetical protein
MAPTRLGSGSSRDLNASAMSREASRENSASRSPYAIYFRQNEKFRFYSVGFRRKTVKPSPSQRKTIRCQVINAKAHKTALELPKLSR